MADQSEKVEVKSGNKETTAPASDAGTVATLREKVDHLFDEFQEGWPFGSKRKRAAHSIGAPFDWGFRSPAIDFVDRGKSIELKAELPGMDENDIEVQLTDRLLTISGEKKEEHVEGEKDSDYFLSERRYGSFKRSISIPEEVDTNKVAASFKKGVLTITLPKDPEALKKAKKIEVKSE